MPPPGAQLAFERTPLWARVWVCIPIVDRFARQWMWSHGGFLVFPPEHPYAVHGPPDGPPDDD